MKINLDDMYIFSEVADSGSYSKASKRSGIAVSTISRRISLLEDRLGVKLLNRTTRQLKLTNAGTSYFESCRIIVAEAKRAEGVLGEFQSEPSGILKLSSFFSLDDEFISILISSCIDKYPKLSFDFIIQNGEMDFISDDIDCMFQLGHLKDSSIVTRGLGEVDICYYAAPNYLEGRGGLSKNADFSSHRLVHFKPHSCSGIPEDSMLKTNIVCSFQTDDLMTARQMALGGAGITRLPSPHARKLVAENRLVKVLSHETVTLPLHLVLGNHRELSKNLRAFVDHLITFSHTSSPWNPL